MESTVIRDDPDRAVSIRLALDGVVMTESRFAAGERGPDPHVHHAHADCFYVLEGTFAVQVGEKRCELGPGDLVLAAPGTVHGRTEVVGGRARLLNLLSPGGLEAADADPVAIAGLDFRLA